MKKRLSSFVLPFPLAVLLADPASAQPNAIPGTDISLSALSSVGSFGHAGTYPNGVAALGMSTTACNPGSVVINWYVAMNPNHPFIAFLVAREKDGRFTQISNRSYCKHPFASTNSGGCGSCTPPGTSSLLGIGCSDTYGASTNASYTWLGPADEIDPWLGTWDPICSYFDHGYPPVAYPANCDGVKSPISYPTSTAPPRVLVNDADFAAPGSTFWAYAGWITKGEPEANRGNNFGSRPFVANWTGSAWAFAVSGSLLPGTILDRWAGATVTSATNGGDDGRLFVGVKVTGPTDGFYHYEFAVHNRDNQRGVAAFRLPICPGTRVENAGFKDIDSDATNDWIFSRTSNEIAWATASNPLLWNMIYNFWFDADAAPLAGSVLLDQSAAGPGAPTVTVTGTAPLGLYNPHLGAGCGSPAAPSLYATGNPAQATLGNATFGLASAGNTAGAPTLLVGSAVDGTIPIASGCTVYMGEIFLFATALANGSGVVSYSLPVPPDGSLEGAHVNFHVAESQIGGAVFGAFDLSDGLRVRLGNSTPGCP